MNLLSVLQGTEMPANGMTGTIEESVSLFELIEKGGVTMVILGVLFVIAMYILVNRVLTIRKAKKDPKVLLEKVKAQVLKGDIDAAKKYCARDTTPMGKMLEAGLKHISSNLNTIEKSIENIAKIELYKLEKSVATVGMISGAAPMIGFFGTVIGMINAFIAISQEEGSVSPKLLSSGIYEAMITTAGGLAVGIFAYISYNFLVRQIEDVVHKMEVVTIEFIELLQSPN
ncbi:MotA/TolQ/ExbB proton channel family protein [Flammeovirga kamogawensis]|uniref:MotA/TolQ/ExbB proton channel family protein n=1 Tax=Flammeovirga kamogawensis TaxID=373891 RepID=A0ABX8GXF5_9BACT|nr:MotA/TolQ/ExbB proton channel family protein [Flammeovirga kamogawensis]MBB6460524.1 biopolymer transport protein ExbB [Flammeovirga kamogawensis]QWG07887.1 MotA/TolQ/ExbB proton channel family protein [Flammeovirga kamogawensis]TRX69693.1 MotA/TolQ/ExbB proton channel family protein [Flammeovirga kamogawensis]